MFQARPQSKLVPISVCRYALPLVDHGHYCIVITLRADHQPCPNFSPRSHCHNNRDQPLVAMLTPAKPDVADHDNWNHSDSHYAPQPRLPDASDVSTMLGSCSAITDNNGTLFQSIRNLFHHNKSECAALLGLGLTW